MEKTAARATAARLEGRSIVSRVGDSSRLTGTYVSETGAASAFGRVGGTTTNLSPTATGSCTSKGHSGRRQPRRVSKGRRSAGRGASQRAASTGLGL